MTRYKLLSKNVAPNGHGTYRFFATIFCVMLVTGCGGSGGSDSKVHTTPTITSAPSPTPEPTPEPTAELTPEPAVEPTPEPSLKFKSPPKGVFHSAGAIRSLSQQTLVSSEVNGQEYVTGTLVRTNWSFINPAEGVYDFSSIAVELDQAIAFDSAISLAIMDGKSMPQYVLDKCETFDFQFREEQFKTCLPWDTEYQHYKKELISKLGAEFDKHPNLAGVYFTYAAMTNGVEMHFRVDEDAFTNAGYTPDRLLQAYNDVMDMYASAFETTSVIMEVHEVFNESYLAESAFDHCYSELGERCGVAIWWCASRMATDPKESEYKVYPVALQAVKLSFAVCQTVGNFTDQPERFDQGQGWTTEEAFTTEMDFFIGQGFRNFELWSKDIGNESLVQIIKENVVPNI